MDNLVTNYAAYLVVVAIILFIAQIIGALKQIGGPITWLGRWAIIKLIWKPAKKWPVPIKPKHRYIFVMGNKKERKEVLAQIRSLTEEYPKRIVNYSQSSSLDVKMETYSRPIKLSIF